MPPCVPTTPDKTDSVISPQLNGKHPTNFGKIGTVSAKQDASLQVNVEIEYALLSDKQAMPSEVDEFDEDVAPKGNQLYPAPIFHLY
jgi:hypothetical protein